MTQIEIEEKLNRTLRHLVVDDRFLLSSDVNERSMTHQLAVYLDDEFSDYDVDCEYNRMFLEGVQVQKESIRIDEMEKVSIGDLNARSAYPDIIIHLREDDRHNLLVIEAKKASSASGEDFKKLNGFMEKKSDRGLGYEFSAFVSFDTENPDNSKVRVKHCGERW